MRLIQLLSNQGSRQVGIVDADEVIILREVRSVHGLAMLATEKRTSLSCMAWLLAGPERVDYPAIILEARLLPPIDHPIATRFAIRDFRPFIPTSMCSDSSILVSMSSGGECESGADSSLAYAGDGTCVLAPEATYRTPLSFRYGLGDPHLVAVYVVGGTGELIRLGFSLGRAYRQPSRGVSPYLCQPIERLACAIGPELLTGQLPDRLAGHVRVLRDDHILWENTLSEAAADIDNALMLFECLDGGGCTARIPGDLYAVLFEAWPSTDPEVKARSGDCLEIDVPTFGAPLRNILSLEAKNTQF